MTPYKKAIRNLFITLLALMVTSLLLVYLLLNNSYTQNWIAGKATDFLSEQFKTKISIGKIRYKAFRTFSLEDIYFGDQKSDTLFFVHQLDFNIGEVNLDSMRFGLQNVRLDGAYCKMTTYADNTFNISVLFNILNPNDTIPDTSGLPFHLYFDKVSMKNSRFKLNDFTVPFEPKGFDGLHEDFYDISLLARDFHIIKDSLILNIKHLGCKEISGFELTTLSSKAILSSTTMQFQDLEIRTPNSHISSVLSMSYTDWEMGNFNEEVYFNGELKESSIDMKDIVYFAPQIDFVKQYFTVSASAKGTVSNLRIRNIDAAFGAESFLKGRINIVGLPNIDETYIDAQVNSMEVNLHDIEPIIDNTFPKQVHNLGRISFSGAYNGFVNDFVAYGSFKTAAGNIDSDINLKLIGEDSIPSYSGNIKLSDFDIGKISEMPDKLGKVTLSLNVDGNGFDVNELNSHIVAKIDKLSALNYTYSGISIEGDFNKKMFEGTFVSLDTNALVDFAGSIDFNQARPSYKFTTNVDYLNLKSLKLDTVEMAISAFIDVDFNFENLDNNNGKIEIDSIRVLKAEKEYMVKQILFKSSSENDSRTMLLKTDGVDVQLKGKYNLLKLELAWKELLSKLFPDYYEPFKSYQTDDFNFTLQAKISNLNVLSDLYFNKFNLKNLAINARYSGEQVSFTSSSSIGSITYEDVVVKDIHFNATKKDSLRSIIIGLRQITRSDSSLLNNVQIMLDAYHNKLVTKINITDSIEQVAATVTSQSLFERGLITTNFTQSDIVIRSVPIDIDPDGLVKFSGNSFKLDELLVSLEKSQSLYINGFYDLNGDHNIRINIAELNLSLTDRIYRKLGFSIAGITNGAMVLKSVSKQNYIDAFLNVNYLAFDGDTVGDFSINSNFNQKQERILLFARSLRGKLKNFEFGGYVETNKTKDNIHLNIAIDESPLVSFQAFFKEQLHIYQGAISMKASISGDFKHPVLIGSAQLKDVIARVEYLKTTYSFTTGLTFAENKIAINNTEIIDVNKNKATLAGELRHDYFSNITLDVKLFNMFKFNVLQTTYKDNELFYGNAYVTGSLTVKGTVDDLFLEARVKTDANSEIAIPFAEITESSDNTLMNFINYDTTHQVKIVQKLTGISGFKMAVYLDITSDAEITMIIDPRNDDRIRGRGVGLLKMELTKQGDFAMYGSVTIEEGDYKLTAMDLFSKKFIIQKGSTISWSGNPLDANMNIRGIYKVRRTSIADFISGATEEQRSQMRNQKVPVDCILLMSGNLMNPDIKFDINFPDLEGMMGSNNVSSLDNSLRTLRNNPDLMNQQVISLLLFGRFAPQNGLTQANTQTNLSSGLNNTLSDIITAQANNLMSQLIPGLDFNVDIQTGGEIEKAQYIFSASKKWFDDRLEVQGSYDPRNFNNSFLTQYNLNRSGNIKARFFNRNAADAIYNRNVTTQGLGLYYSKEFDKFNEIFKAKNKKDK